MRSCVKNIVETDRQFTDNNIIRCMRVTFWITKATNPQSEYLIFNSSLGQT